MYCSCWKLWSVSRDKIKTCWIDSYGFYSLLIWYFYHYRRQIPLTLSVVNITSTSNSVFSGFVWNKTFISRISHRFSLPYLFIYLLNVYEFFFFVNLKSSAFLFCRFCLRWQHGIKTWSFYMRPCLALVH